MVQENVVRNGASSESLCQLRYPGLLKKEYVSQTGYVPFLNENWAGLAPTERAILTHRKFLN
jgi:hypothetical protein